MDSNERLEVVMNVAESSLMLEVELKHDQDSIYP